MRKIEISPDQLQSFANRAFKDAYKHTLEFILEKISTEVIISLLAQEEKAGYLVGFALGIGLLSEVGYSLNAIKDDVLIEALKNEIDSVEEVFENHIGPTVNRICSIVEKRYENRPEYLRQGMYSALLLYK